MGVEEYDPLVVHHTALGSVLQCGKASWNNVACSGRSVGYWIGSVALFVIGSTHVYTELATPGSSVLFHECT